MATPNSFSPLIKLFLYSALSLALLSCFVGRSCAFDGRKLVNSDTNFHTLEISSLLPASVCSPSTVAKGPNKRQSTLEVFHRHGPCSQPTQSDKSTTTAPPTLTDVLSSDQSRVESIQARLNPDKNNKINDEKANLPAQSGLSLGTGNYIVSIGLGTPTKTLSLIFDTGSDLTWTQCEPCATSCHQQQDPIFNPSSSASYSNVPCSSTQCSQLTSATNVKPGCSSTTCIYGIKYGDGSFTVGNFGKEKLTITSHDAFPNFLFGCGQYNQGLFGRAAGLIGLGKDPLSIVSQTATTYGKYFSYCLPSTSSSTGHLTFGNSGGGGVRDFTPFADSRGTSFYFIDIVSISVGGQQLPISQSVFQSRGTIIDSGTVITRLPATAYSQMRAAFRQLMQSYPSAPATRLLDTCFDFSNYAGTRLSIPPISFTFGGNVTVHLDVSGILFPIGMNQACLAFAGNNDDSDIGIFGNTQQKALEVVYDVAGGKLGFGAGGCN